MAGVIRVLYVDDEPDLLDLARLFLEQTGDIQVTTSTSATAALDDYPTALFDLIISDYQMPEMDGITFLKEVRQRFGDIPFILFTGRGREEVVIEAINNGADFYLQKGGSSKAQFAELVHKIRQAMLRKRLEISRIKAERELRESEEKFRDIFNNINDGIQIFEMDESNYPGRFVDVNDVACRMAQYSREELLQKTPGDLDRGPHSKPGVVIRKELKERGISTFEAMHARKDGSRIPVEISVHSVLLAGKRVSIAVVRDITERKAAGESLTESELKFRTIFEKSHDAFLMFTDGGYTDCNQCALDLFGYSSREEITGVKPWELSLEKQPNGQESSIAASVRIRTAMEQGSNQFEWIHKRKDGSIFTADVLLSVYELSGRQVIFTSIRDITGRKKMEEALFDSRQMLQAVLDSIPQRVFWKDRNSVFLGCNKPLALDVGYSDPADMVGKTDDDHASRAIADRYRADDRQVMETGRPKIAYEEPQIRSDGSLAWLMTSKFPLRRQDGTIIGVLGTYEDITSQKLAQENLRESEEKYR